MSTLIISLDFELFWGVTDSKTIVNYGQNIEGAWQSVPGMLKLFKQYNIQATWATVGMLMCKDFKQWSDLRPAVMPTYTRESCSTYSFSTLARDHKKLFFAPSLVKSILSTQGQELASHTYSHFYCGEANASVEQFAADLDCVKWIYGEYGVTPTSLVFPRNQVREEYLKVVRDKGFTAYRGNQDHRLYRAGHLVAVPNAKAWRLARVADAYLPLSGNHTFALPTHVPEGQLVNIPASAFLRPVSNYPLLDWMHSHKIKKGMLEAAKTNRNYHLWWHPHNFGKQTEANLNALEKLLKYYQKLNQEYGMQSVPMAELGASCRTQ